MSWWECKECDEFAGLISLKKIIEQHEGIAYDLISEEVVHSCGGYRAVPDIVLYKQAWKYWEKGNKDKFCQTAMLLLENYPYSEQAKKITDDINHGSVKLKEKGEIRPFHSLLDKHDQRMLSPLLVKQKELSLRL